DLSICRSASSLLANHFCPCIPMPQKPLVCHFPDSLLLNCTAYSSCRSCSLIDYLRWGYAAAHKSGGCRLFTNQLVPLGFFFLLKPESVFGKAMPTCTSA